VKEEEEKDYNGGGGEEEEEEEKKNMFSVKHRAKMSRFRNTNPGFATSAK
jgi:hypothetical protein